MLIALDWILKIQRLVSERKSARGSASLDAHTTKKSSAFSSLPQLCAVE
jgi:hypothetical protein